MTGNALYITTSWDDGHPLDIKVAELLLKYGLAATFYVPLRNCREVMDPDQLRELSSVFEIGGHTVSHCDLRAISLRASENEIHHCKDALEQITCAPCRSFCFPMGRFRRSHLQQVRDAGFTVARTVELMSLATPRTDHGLWLMPTTIQAVPAGFGTYVKNSVKRLRPDNLARYVRVRKGSWVNTLEMLLKLAGSRGGVVHLWGHSWEIGLHSDWQNLEDAFSLLAQYKGRASFVSNGELPYRLGTEVPTPRARAVFE